jgi:hypothetical protein
VQHAAARRDLPLFRLVARAGDRIDPWVDGLDPNAQHEPVPLGDFVTRLLTRRVVLMEPPAHTRRLSAVAEPATYWACHRPLWRLVSFANAPPGLFAPNGWLPARDLPKVPALLAEYQRAPLVLMTAAPELTVLRRPRRDARPEFQAYCPECDAPQSWRRPHRARPNPAPRRCWSLQDGREWSLRDWVPPRWIVVDGSMPAL